MDFRQYFKGEVKKTERLVHRGNNILYRIESDEGVYLLKKYSPLQKDGWNRGKNEFLAISILSAEKFPVPYPFEFHEDSQIGIYSFERGKSLLPSEVNDYDMKKMAGFLSRLHQLDSRIKIKFNPERTRCFSIRDYIELLYSRYKNLLLDFSGSEENKQFLRNDFHKKMKDLVQGVISKSKDLDKKLTLEQQVVTPGDFGFHNALVYSGHYTFLDFEYCGRDDPIKQILDFLHHDKTKEISKELKEVFLKHYTTNFSMSQEVEERMHLVDPLIGLNWTLIYLNVLSRTYQEHLKFSGHDVEKVITERVGKAKEKINNLTFLDKKN